MLTSSATMSLYIRGIHMCRRCVALDMSCVVMKACFASKGASEVIETINDTSTGDPVIKKPKAGLKPKKSQEALKVSKLSDIVHNEKAETKKKSNPNNKTTKSAKKSASSVEVKLTIKTKTTKNKDDSDSGIDIIKSLERRSMALNALNDVLREDNSPMILLSKYSLYGDQTDTRIKEQKTSYTDYISNLISTYNPSVTKIISDTMSEKSRFYLERWKQEQIELLGEEGFNIMQKETLARGKDLHNCIERVLKGEPVQSIEPRQDNEGHWKSISPVLLTIGKVYGIEDMVSHEDLRYRGKVDCVAEYRDSVCVIDWKTSKKRKARLEDTFDNPLQLAAYAGAINGSSFLKDKEVDAVKNALLVVCYSDGQPAHVHFLTEKTLTLYWKQWLSRLGEYWIKQSKENDKSVS